LLSLFLAEITKDVAQLVYYRQGFVGMSPSDTPIRNRIL
jgi:hypothetical protein